MYFPIDSAHGKSSVSLFPEPWAGWGNQEERGRHPETNNNKSLLWSLRKKEKRGLHCRLIGRGSTENLVPSYKAGTTPRFRKRTAPASFVEPEQGVQWCIKGACPSVAFSFPAFSALHRLSLLEGCSQSSPKGSLPEASSWALVIIEHKGKLLTEPYSLSDA